MSLKTVLIIPSRIGSTRLKNKPLVEISGKTLIQRVYENAGRIYNGISKSMGSF